MEINPVNAAICSFGMSGRVFHAPFLSTNPKFRFYAVWERSKKSADEKYPNVKSYADYADMLADANVHLVIVNTPNYTHYTYTKQALLAGKHVVVEKPFTVNSSEGKELIALAREKNLKLTVFHNRRYDSDFRTVRKVLAENLIGEVAEAEIHFDRFKQELSPKQHKEIPGPGTGVLYDLGSHLIDQALQLFGKPSDIFADIAIMRPISKVDDYFELLLYYATKRVRVKASYVVREALPGYIFHGSKGSFIKARTDIQENMLQAGHLPTEKNWGVEPDNEKGLLHTERDGKIIREYVVSDAGNYGDFFNALYDSIRLDTAVPVSPEDGLLVVKLIEAAFESNSLKKVISVE